VNLKERELLVQIAVNVDDIVKELSIEQLEKLRPSINKINGNYYNLLDGVS